VGGQQEENGAPRNIAKRPASALVDLVYCENDARGWNSHALGVGRFHPVSGSARSVCR